MKERAHLWIDGRVQGVAFRYFTVEVAQKLALAGWVRNLPDRRVEAVFEGERNVIEKAIELCSSGPPFAHVTNIKLSWDELTEGLDGFHILR